ncbi:sulfurtransferase complex subunit TusD [Pseudomaricurvus alkylphenolicus]|jgi:tRNA 2-thiouridine synthesizing protein D|uniref:sulfurtransferase complex subunit TusD n=1 Tax=Pseudomaricurvus alkylphenolicus TaxID=1306991 RepID=UPI0014229EA3|nr:sulfurtransferase complex subunit TusD [Pseudomaricurvus alkylphenolicus]NIB41189.1 sulfurtransferase complex subunit TusD [Pseudomaricurvus alkylphenolicus]
MKFALVVQSPPTAPYSESALRFAHSLLQQGHQLYRVFFSGDGTLNGSALHSEPESAIQQRWQQLHQVHGVDLVVCISAALKRGIVDASNARRLGLNGENLLPGFELSGLGQLADAGVSADRVISFG